MAKATGSRGLTRPVEWHERTLACMRESLTTHERELASKQGQVDRLRQEIIEHHNALEAARHAGLKEFDMDRMVAAMKRRLAR